MAATLRNAARDRLGLIDDAMQQHILAARHAFAAGLPEDLRGAVEFFDAERYNPAMPVEENILFGTILSGESDALERVHAAIGEVLDELDLRALVITVGLVVGFIAISVIAPMYGLVRAIK